MSGATGPSTLTRPHPRSGWWTGRRRAAVSASSSITVGTASRRVPAGRPLPVWYSLMLAVPLTVATVYGLVADHAYRTPADIAAQGRGQDLLTLLTVPLLIGVAGRARA